MNEDCDSTAPVETPEDSADPEPDQRLSIELVIQAGDWPEVDTLSELTANVARVMPDVLGPDMPDQPESRHEVALALGSDETVRSANNTFRGKDEPTNVLSFPMPDTQAGSPTTPAFIGDIVLAEQTLRREAAERSLPFEHHFVHLVVHGVLHLYGFDHQTDVDAEEMEATEIAVLRRLGIANPYPIEHSAKEALGSAGS